MDAQGSASQGEIYESPYKNITYHEIRSLFLINFFFNFYKTLIFFFGLFGEIVQNSLAEKLKFHR